ncbi:MAG: leucine--tRNA ligase [Nanoarchaeota archaeon]|nr:leucine--tRNA ligase [Nanoarchaeota archaeon]
MDIHVIEKKWVKKWKDAKIFESEVGSRKKFFATFPYPYVNLSPHVGHAYSAIRNDMVIRFYRMLGYNTLFPFGFHATGEPIVGAAKRVKKGEESQIKAFEKAGIKKEEIEKFKDPEFIVKYFVNEWVKDMGEFGLAVDWRRSFYTTSLNQEYNAFVTWQFNKLKEKGLLVKGTHPVIYCPECDSACGSHDRKEGEDATIEEYVLLKFKLGDEHLIAATLRPETVFGQTNLWVNPDTSYVRIKVGKEEWVVSEIAYEKLKWQQKDLEKLGNVKGSTLIGRYAKAPMIKKEIIILPGLFVNPNVGTGIVTSVPSDAPFDYIALKMLQRDENLCKKYGLDIEEIKKIKPIPIIKTEELGEFSAEKACNDYKIKSLNQKDLLEKATKHVYKIGFHKGVMNKNCGKYAGKKVELVKDKVSEEMIKNNEAGLLHEMSEPVVCRCLTNCVIKILENQWFIKYSDEIWKKKTLKCLNDMRVLPEEARNVMKNMIIKMKDKACARKSGLGTPLPCDPKCNIECLSDSTIYMSYYIIQKHVHNKEVSVKNMKPEFFDYVLLKKGEPRIVAKKTGLSEELIKQLKKEFEYWYPVDLRNSGKDLLTNHLIFFLYNHTAFWPEKYWPKAIGANGWVTVDGMKMSKSKGNFVTLRDAINKYGNDASRLAFMDTGEGISDADFSTKAALSFKNKLVSIIERVEMLKDVKGKDKDVLDEWLLSKVQKRIKNTTIALKDYLNRTALKDSFHGLLNDVNYYYDKKKNLNTETLNYFWSVFSRLNVPFIPHTCEEVNELLGSKEFVHNLKYPVFDKKLVNESVEENVELLKDINYDVKNIIKLVGKKPKNITLIISPAWKYDFFKEFKKAFEKKKDVKELINLFMKQEEYKKNSKQIIGLINALVKDLSKLPDKVTNQKEEFEAFNKNKKFIEEEFNSEVIIVKAEDSKNLKAQTAIPGKPGILIE